MSRAENPSYSHKRLTASGLVRNGAGLLRGVFCSSSSSGTLQILDDATNTGSNIVINTFNLTAGTFYPFDYEMERGIYAVVGGTTDISFSYT